MLEYILGGSESGCPAASAASVMVGCDEELGEIPREEWLRGRNGGANNPDIQFNGSRKPCGICIPGDVVVSVRYSVHVNGAYNAGEADDKTSAEEHGDDDALADGQV